MLCCLILINDINVLKKVFLMTRVAIKDSHKFPQALQSVALC